MYYTLLSASFGDYLEHHGILGMKWGIRRFQNKNGTLTALGRKHLGIGPKQQPKQVVAVKPPEDYKPSDEPMDLNSLSYGENERLIKSGRDFILEHGHEFVSPS